MPTAGMKLDLARVRELYQRHGTRVLYKKSEPCECMSVGDANNPDYTCPECNGLGIRFYETIDMTVIMVSKNTKESIERYGLLEVGTIAVSIPDTFRDLTTGELYQEFIPARWDLLICSHDKMRHAEILERGKVHPISGESRERAVYLNVIPSTSRISQLSNKVYVEGQDYEIVPDKLGYSRMINWLPDGNSPKEGERYSFSYTTNPTYCLFDLLPRHRREDSLMIMTAATAKLISLVDQFK